MVILVGTDHTLQTTRLQLKAYLEGLCRKFNIRAIAEEMNAEALSDLNTVSSIPQRVAGVLRIPHRYCDGVFGIPRTRRVSSTSGNIPEVPRAGQPIAQFAQIVLLNFYVDACPVRSSSAMIERWLSRVADQAVTLGLQYRSANDNCLRRAPFPDTCI